MGKKLGGTLAIEESTGKPEIYEKLLADNPTIKTRTDFSTTFTETNVNTLYKAKEKQLIQANQTLLYSDTCQKQLGKIWNMARR